MALMVDKFVNIPNRVLLYQLYNYVSDMRSVMSMVNSHIKWHGERLGYIHTGSHNVFTPVWFCLQGEGVWHPCPGQTPRTPGETLP